LPSIQTLIYTIFAKSKAVFFIHVIMFLRLQLIFQTFNKTQGKKGRWWSLALHDAIRFKCSTSVQWKWMEWLSYHVHGKIWDSDGGVHKFQMFWNVVPCRLVCSYWHSGGICCLKIQVQQYNLTFSERDIYETEIFWYLYKYRLIRAL
jgi:hypothetical protein